MMQNIAKNKELIEKLKNLVETAEFLAMPEKAKWLEMADSLELADLHEACKYFTDAQTSLQDKKLEVIYKAGLGEEYVERIKKLADGYRKEGIQREEKHLKATTENPDDVLKQLDDL